MSLITMLGIATVWCLIVGSFSPRKVLFGLLLGAIYAAVTGTWRRARAPVSNLPRRLAYLAIYALILVPYDIVQSNFDLARRLLRRTPDIDPGIVRMSIGHMPPAASALVAHAITMSPGEVVVDYSEDEKTMYIHLIDVSAATSKRAEFWQTYHKIIEKVLS